MKPNPAASACYAFTLIYNCYLILFFFLINKLYFFFPYPHSYLFSLALPSVICRFHHPVFCAAAPQTPLLSPLALWGWALFPALGVSVLVRPSPSQLRFLSFSPQIFTSGLSLPSNGFWLESNKIRAMTNTGENNKKWTQNLPNYINIRKFIDFQVTLLSFVACVLSKSLEKTQNPGNLTCSSITNRLMKKLKEKLNLALSKWNWKHNMPRPGDAQRCFPEASLDQ